MLVPDQVLPYQLNDRYDWPSGRVFLTGTQALVRVMLDQARRDRRDQLNTAGFISGYRGSPLGALDLELWRNQKRLKADRITFMPAVNEDLGATAVLGAQQATLEPDCEHDGIFSMWYGKGPGVDRSGDALRHGNAYGSSPKGGVLVVAGDDHGCVSSSMPHQSDVAFMTWFMPTLNPASVAEYLTFGEYGLALSRFSGTWVGFKAISETVESARSVDLPADRQFHYPEIDVPPGGLHVRSADLPSIEIESRIGFKLRAVEAFIEANPIDRRIYDIKDARFGIVTTGKAHLDLMEALRLLGFDEAKCRDLGVDIYKVGMVWPLARRDALSFVSGKHEVLVVEEKRGIIESQFKEYFYDWSGSKPRKMVGKHDGQATRQLVPWTGELSPLQLVPIIAERLNKFFPKENLFDKANALTGTKPFMLQVAGATRTPYFCSGCPHNTSTKIPEGSKAASGIGCHVMASWMNRETVGYAQMGGEGVPWVVASKFNGGKHMFQNLGEGTWYHSGSLAIRQAVAAGANITYKILYNDAVAMTGGQPVDGPVSVAGIAQTCRAEGVERIAVVSDAIDKFNKADFPSGTSFHSRGQLDPLQRELRQIPGVTTLIYEQTCATELRRRRKRGKAPDPNRHVWINPLVCEGCGDCSVESNCLSIEPRDTLLGRKRQVNLSTCNKDFSCLNGFCPSFVTITGGERRRQAVAIDATTLSTALPVPVLPNLAQPFNLMVAGVGGTGVVTIGALITMAAHLEGKASSLLDFTGFAQKFGTVISYIRLANEPDELNQVRIERGAADAMIACDAVVGSSPKASAHYRPGTQVVLNTAAMPTGDIVLRRDADLRIDDRERLIHATVGADNVSSLNANQLAQHWLGDSVFANMMMLGYAWQQGLIPVGLESLRQAINLNGVAVDDNNRALLLGRILAADPKRLNEYQPAGPVKETDSEAVIKRRAQFLADYQDDAYAQRYVDSIDRFASQLPEEHDDALVTTAARSLFKLMAYKDEYEVARLQTDPQFNDELGQHFTGNFRINHHLAPPLLPMGRDARGRPVKRQFGPWIRTPMRWLARCKSVRGSRLDPFGYTAERRKNRELITWFEQMLASAATHYDAAAHDQWIRILSAPQDMRGFGPVWDEAVQKYQAIANDTLDTLTS